MPADIANDTILYNGDKTVHAKLVLMMAKDTAFEMFGNNLEPDYAIRKRKINATKTFGD